MEGKTSRPCQRSPDDLAALFGRRLVQREVETGMPVLVGTDSQTRLNGLYPTGESALGHVHLICPISPKLSHIIISCIQADAGRGVIVKYNRLFLVTGIFYPLFYDVFFLVCLEGNFCSECKIRVFQKDVGLHLIIVQTTLLDPVKHQFGRSVPVTVYGSKRRLVHISGSECKQYFVVGNRYEFAILLPQPIAQIGLA